MFQIYPGFSMAIGTVGMPTRDSLFIWVTTSFFMGGMLILVYLNRTYFRPAILLTKNISPIYLGLFFFIICILIKFFLIKGLPLADDEYAYLHAARLIADGKLSEPSHAMPVLFDKAFMLNNGRYFSQYFLGWPLFLGAGEFFQIGSLINPLFFFGSAILLYLIIANEAGHRHGIIAMTMYAISPIMLIGAATNLSHTSCSFFILFSIFFYFKNSRKPSSINWLAFSTSLVIAFWIRPYTALLALTPFCVTLLISFVREPKGNLFGIASGGTILILGSLVFLYVNYELYGNVLSTGYSKYYDYVKSSGTPFNYWGKVVSDVQFEAPGFNLSRWLNESYLGFVRLANEGLAWPGAVFVIFALAWGLITTFRILAISIFLIVFGYAYWGDAGIDTFAPVHLTEAAPLIICLLLTLTGTKTKKLSKRNATNYSLDALTLYLSICIFISLTVLPFKLGILSRVISDIQIPYNAVAAAGLKKAIIFAPQPFTPQLLNSPTRHFVFWWPTNAPGLNEDIIWANDLGEKENIKAMNYFPERNGYMLKYYTANGNLTVDLQPIHPQY